jgi:hypothetical protein
MASTFDLATLIGHLEPLKHKASSIIFATDSSGNTISVEEAILDLQNMSVSVEHPSLAQSICDIGLIVGQFVYIDGTGEFNAGLADDISTSDVVGVIVDVDSAGSPCIVKATGGLPAYFSLTPGAIYYLSETVPGGLQTTVPTTPGNVIKRVGTAINETTLMIDLTQRLIIRS